MNRTWKTVLEIISVLLVAVLVAIFIQAFVIRAFIVPTGSMEPTLKIGNRIVVSAGDISLQNTGIKSHLEKR